MNKKKKLLLIGGAIIVVIILIILVIVSSTNKKKEINQPIVNNQGNQVKTEATTTKVEAGKTSDPFEVAIPKNIKVPTANEVLPDNLKKEVAVPTVVVPAAPGATTKFRSFNIKAEGGKFIPSQIIVNVGDTVHVNFTAVDKDYDIVFSSYNMKQTAKKGQTKVLEFQALKSGNFIYYCDLCGGPNSKTKGNFIIVK